MKLQEQIYRIQSMMGVINESNIDDYLKLESFNDLPFEYKKSLIIYMYEGDPVEWSINTPIEDVVNNNELINILINDYSKGIRKRKLFYYGLVPIDVLKDEIKVRLNYKSFDEYHEWYGDVTDHGKSILPIIIDFNDEELIIDGWHRFHSYVKKEINKIPVVGKYID